MPKLRTMWRATTDAVTDVATWIAVALMCVFGGAAAIVMSVIMCVMAAAAGLAVFVASIPYLIVEAVQSRRPVVIDDETLERYQLIVARYVQSSGDLAVSARIIGEQLVVEANGMTSVYRPDGLLVSRTGSVKYGDAFGTCSVDVKYSNETVS